MSRSLRLVGEAETLRFASRLGKRARGGDLLCLSGPLGSGKRYACAFEMLNRSNEARPSLARWIVARATREELVGAHGNVQTSSPELTTFRVFSCEVFLVGLLLFFV